MSNAAIEYRTKLVSMPRNGEVVSVYLIAYPCTNSLMNCMGFILFKRQELTGFDARFEEPFIGSLLFETVEQAFEIGEYVLRNLEVDHNNARL